MRLTSLLFFILLLIFNVMAENRWIPLSPGADQPAMPQMENLGTTQRQVVFTYEIPGILVNNVSVRNEEFQTISIPGWGINVDPGKPKVPVLGKYIAVPRGASVAVRVTDEDVVTLSGYHLYPAQPLAIDSDEFPQPEFTIDRQFYSRDTSYPATVAAVSEQAVMRGVSMVRIGISPVQYNPAKQELTVHRRFRVEVTFSGAGDYVADQRLRNTYYETLYKNLLLNYRELGPAPQISASALRGNGADMIILTTSQFLPAADTLAAWKNILGIRTVVAVTNEVGNTPAQIKNYLQNAYDNWNPAPAFLLIIGDNDDVPSYYSNAGSYSHVTDLYYEELDGSDYFPDIAAGRLSVTTPDQAMKRVRDIIKYEKNPITDPGFYSRSTHAAYFQEASGGYAERRFAQTSEEIVQQMLSQGYTAERIFYTEPSVNPTHWNNGYYSNGEPIPAYLLKSNGFLWNGNANDISSAINNGTFFVTHRDHGGETGWGDPAYNTTHVSALQNGDKLPVVFSLNCLTGRFDYAGTCFSEAWERNPNGGAIGVIAATEVSYSGCNDGFADGLVDAIWPGLVPSFPHNPNPSVTPHDPIYQLGLVLNQGKFRMTETWGASNPPFNYEEYTFELFHWFGDPSMEIRTAAPQQFVVSHPPTIIMGSSSFSVNVDAEGARVVISRNGQILGEAYASAGTANVTLANPVTTPDLLSMAIYKHNFVPYLATLQPIAATGPYLYCINPIVYDTSLNGNGIPEGGETIGLRLRMTNLGIDPATNITASISTADTFLTLLDDSSQIALVDTADTVIAGEFSLSISPNIPHLHNCAINLHMEADGGYAWDQTLFMRVREGARIELSDVALEFPNTFLTFTSSLPLTIQNTGKDTLFISDIYSGLPQFSANPTNLTIPPDQSVAVQVNFVPDSTLFYSDSITIRNSDPIHFRKTFAVSGTGIYAPDISGPDSIVQAVGVTDSLTINVELTNAGLGELNFNAQIAGWDPNNSSEGAGGSDAFGHMWIDSDEPSGPTFDWIDITNTGTALALTGNNSISSPLDLGFDFSFYGQNYQQVRACTNGWLSFTTFSVAYNNFALPSNLAPRALISPLWDDLVFLQDSKAYFENQGTKVVLLYQNVYRVSGEGPYTFETVLYNNGNILFQYLNLDSLVDDYTVGIQDHLAQDGLTIAYNSPYLHDSLAVLISKHSWVSVTPMSGTIQPGETTPLQLTFRTHEFPEGDFWASLQVESNDPDENMFVIPIHMRVTVTGLEKGEELSARSFRLYQNSPNPFNPTTLISYRLPEAAEVELVVYNLLGQRIRTLVNSKQPPRLYKIK